MVVTDVMGQVERRLLSHCYECGPNVYHRSATNLPQWVTYHVLVLFFQGEKGESGIQGRDEKVCKLPLAIITEKNIIKISLTLKMTTAATVLFRTTINRTIKLNLLLKWLLGSNLSQKYHDGVGRQVSEIAWKGQKKIELAG